MAPEVFLNHSYNEKSDVFSFGVVLYELMARTLVVFTELPTNSTDPTVPQRYAQKVADGYRPARPKSMPDTMWALITACWHRDPLLRPHMSEVVSVLSSALEEALTAQLAPSKLRPSFSFSKRSGADQQAKPSASSCAAAALAQPAPRALPQVIKADSVRLEADSLTCDGTSAPQTKDQQEPAAEQPHISKQQHQEQAAASSQGCCVIC